MDFNGPTICVQDYICAYIDRWYSQCISTAKVEFQKTCTSAGRANADIAGIGVLITLATQALISIMLTLLCGPIKEPRGSGSSGSSGSKMVVMINLLLATVDIQVITGIALVVSALSMWRTTDLYHFHIVYDITSISSASIWPALCRVSAEYIEMGDKLLFVHRILASLIFLVFYTTLTIAFGIRMNGWDANTPGQCFEGKSWLRPIPDDPPSHKVGLALTNLMVTIPFSFSLFVAWMSAVGGRILSNTGNYGLLIWAIIQIIVHITFFVQLRNSDQHFLVPDESENQWTFGQIIVMFTLMAMALEFYREIKTGYMERRQESRSQSAEN